ncbi:MAG: DegT/DnrJ/EryC1/StrS family aminotransferase [Acidobacteria bacterium]|nr:DegT/DnrJ/EryC1/StrS family aminotransferase [Acidobacteriota bacterium]
MSVPLLDLKAQYQNIKSEIMSAVESIFESQYFILGKEGVALEEALAPYCDTKFAIGCASGSDALLIALMAIDIKPGDEVITTPFTFFATGGSVSRLGAKPVFVDIDPDTFNIDPKLIEEKITSRTRAIIPVHLFGQCAEMNEILEIANRHNLVVIEDAAQAIGSEYYGKRAGSMGLIGCLSFFPSKNLGAAGDAGMMLTSDPDLAEKLRVLRVHGGKPKYYYRMLGVNSRLDELQATVLKVKFNHLESWTKARQENASRYDKLFADYKLIEQVKLPKVLSYCRHIFHQYTICVSDRDQLMKHLKDNDIGTEVYYPLSLHQQDCFAYLGQLAGSLPKSEQAANQVLSLPIYPELTLEQQDYVVSTIAKFYAQK